MPIVKTEAFVLKSFRYGETSKIVTLFTKEFGKINVIVKGARTYKSKLCGVLESMNHVNTIIYLKENRDLHLLTNAEYKKSYTNILNDFDKLQASFRIIEMLNKSVIENDINESIFELLIKTYEMLDETEKNIYQCVLYFQIELVKILGLSPDFSEPGNDLETFFENNEFYLSKSQLRELKILKNNSVDRLIETTIENGMLVSLIEGYERYLLLHTQGLKYYKSKKIFLELKQSI